MTPINESIAHCQYKYSRSAKSIINSIEVEATILPLYVYKKPKSIHVVCNMYTKAVFLYTLEIIGKEIGINYIHQCSSCLHHKTAHCSTCQLSPRVPINNALLALAKVRVDGIADGIAGVVVFLFGIVEQVAVVVGFPNVVIQFV